MAGAVRTTFPEQVTGPVEVQERDPVTCNAPACFKPH